MWLESRGKSRCPALFVSSRDTRLSADQLYQIVGKLAKAAGIDRTISPHKIRHSSITALLDLTDGRQQLQGRLRKSWLIPLSGMSIVSGKVILVTNEFSDRVYDLRDGDTRPCGIYWLTGRLE